MSKMEFLDHWEAKKFEKKSGNSFGGHPVVKNYQKDFCIDLCTHMHMPTLGTFVHGCNKRVHTHFSFWLNTKALDRILNT